MGEGGRIDVLVIDDSAVVRNTLRRLLDADAAIGIVDVAADPFVAVEAMRRRRPDVVILDIEMPRMDGLTFLRKLMSQHPIPVVMCSAHVGEGSSNAVEALECGAVELITKPRVDTAAFLEESRERVVTAVTAAAAANVERLKSGRRAGGPPRRAPARVTAAAAGRVVVVGASTGGVEALHEMLEPLPADVPPIVVAQHMPEHFTAALARRLDETCALSVREARAGDILVPGVCLVAPGSGHVVLSQAGERCRVDILNTAPVNRHRPSVDTLFTSAAMLGPRVMGVLLTGMGDDGAAGMLRMREAGARTIAQDEETSVVWGMPGAAVAHGAACEVVPLHEIASRIVSFASQREQQCARG